MKKSRSPLFDEYGSDDECLQAAHSAVATRLNQYLGIKFNKETDDCLSFWVCYQKSFDKLFVPALVALSIPASMQCTCGTSVWL
jgi:hypothetical protein